MSILKRLARWVLLLLGILILIFYVILPLVVGFVATRSASRSVGDSPPAFQTLTLTTADEVQLGAWYTPPQNGAVILVLAGAGGSRANMRSQAEMLVKHGFGVLLLDLRGHGTSQGQTNKFGWAGTQDVGAAMTYLQTQTDVKAIGGWGSSLGGEVLLGAVSSYPTLQAVVSDGATYRCLAEFKALPEHGSLLMNFPYRVLDFSVKLFSGDEAPATPLLESIQNADSSAFLFIAGAKEQEEVDFNTHFAATVGERGRLWVAPDVGHTGAFGRYPDEYETRVIQFFEETLLKDL